MNNNSKHEINKIEYYKNKGYTASYHLINNKLIDVDTKKEYTVKDVTIDEEYRYEGYSNPADLSILYILTMHDGTKGTILAAYGPSANIELTSFLNKCSSKKILNSLPDTYKKCVFFSFFFTKKSL